MENLAAGIGFVLLLCLMVLLLLGGRISRPVGFRFQGSGTSVEFQFEGWRRLDIREEQKIGITVAFPIRAALIAGTKLVFAVEALEGHHSVIAVPESCDHLAYLHFEEPVTLYMDFDPKGKYRIHGAYSEVNPRRISKNHPNLPLTYDLAIISSTTKEHPVWIIGGNGTDKEQSEPAIKAQVGLFGYGDHPLRPYSSYSLDSIEGHYFEKRRWNLENAGSEMLPNLGYRVSIRPGMGEFLVDIVPKIGICLAGDSQIGGEDFPVTSVKVFDASGDLYFSDIGKKELGGQSVLHIPCGNISLNFVNDGDSLSINLKGQTTSLLVDRRQQNGGLLVQFAQEHPLMADILKAIVSAAIGSLIVLAISNN